MIGTLKFLEKTAPEEGYLKQGPLSSLPPPSGTMTPAGRKENDSSSDLCLHYSDWYLNILELKAELDRLGPDKHNTGCCLAILSATSYFLNTITHRLPKHQKINMNHSNHLKVSWEKYLTA